MIVVSQGVGVNSTSGSNTTTVASGGAKTISIQSSGVQKTVTLARTASGIATGGQLITLPNQGLVASGQQTITLGGKPVTVQVSTASGQKTVTLVNTPGAGQYLLKLRP